MANHTCDAPGCVRPTRFPRGACSTHRQRLARLGSYDLPSRADRFSSKVDKLGPVPEYAPHLGRCWLWTAATDRHGYGKYFIGKTADQRTILAAAHRVSYEKSNGSIPEGLHLDHLCRVPLCVRPSHLEPVTPRENIMRGVGLVPKQVLRTHCPRGHPYDEVNTYQYGSNRKCKACGYEANKRCNERRKLGLVPPRRRKSNTELSAAKLTRYWTDDEYRERVKATARARYQAKKAG